MSLASSSSLFLAARLVKLGMTLVISWLLAYGLGPEQRGAYFVLALLTSSFLFKVSNLGASSANQVLVARDPTQAGTAAAVALWGGIGVSTLVVLLAVAAFPLWGPLYEFPVLDRRLGIMLATIPLGIAASQFEGILMAQKRFLLVNAIHLGATAFLLGLLATLLLGLGMGLDGAVAAAGLQAVLIFLLFAAPFRKAAVRLPDRRYLRAQVSFGSKLEAVNFLAYLANQASGFLLRPLGITDAAIGNFGPAKGLAEQTWAVTDSATPVLLPGLSAMPKAEARATTARACRVLVLLQVLAALAAWAAACWLVPLVLPKYTQIASTLVFLLPGTVLGVIPKILSCYAVSVGKPLYGLAVTGAGLLVAASSAWLLIPGHGIHGAAAATALGYAAEAAVSVAIFRHLSGAGLLETLLVRREDLRIYGRRLGMALGVLKP